MKIFALIGAVISVALVALLAPAIHESQGTARTILYCAIGVAAIWIFGYLKARLFGWIRPDKEERDSPDRKRRP